jgi:threonyl-tRNA synthetase
MAAAIMSLWPNAKRGVGPAIDNGFYQDLDIPDHKLSPEDLPKIEKKMEEMKKAKLKFIKIIKKIDEAIDYEKERGQLYKVEILEDIKKTGDKEVSYYQMGDYIDLCRGPHVEDTSQIGYFKLDKLAGAYWRGDEKRPMLQRVYGLCFAAQEELDKYLWQQEEAAKRDHRLLGKKLDLFVIDENIGKGLPLLTPKGTLIRKQILDYEYKLEQKYGFQHVVTPHIARSELYKKTGHWQHYREVMYESFGIEGEEYVLKPMNCPHHYMIYKSQPRSYRDLPLRLTEPGTCYRFEKTGELSGLVRVRALTIDDTHILMTDDQIESEFKRCIEMVNEMFRVLGLKDYFVRLSLPDPSDAVKYIADKKIWDRAGEKLEKIVKDNKLNYKIAKGEASFYGPKLDYMVKDSIGRQWQMSTLQLDLFMGKRLNLVYTDEEGKERNPVILHRGLTGSIERTLAILIEHYAGAFPLWLSPVQVAIIPIADRHKAAARHLQEILLQNDIRTSLDDRNESMQAKIRDATLQKVPYMSIIGDREAQNKENPLVSVRTREGKDLGQMTTDQFLHKLQEEIEKKH